LGLEVTTYNLTEYLDSHFDLINDSVIISINLIKYVGRGRFVKVNKYKDFSLLILIFYIIEKAFSQKYHTK